MTSSSPVGRAGPWSLAFVGVAAGALALAWPTSQPPDPPVGRLRRLTWDDHREFAPTLSPSGSTVVYVVDGDQGPLARMRVEGGRPQPLVPGATGEHYDPAFSLDGGHVAYGTESGLWLVGATGEDPRRLGDPRWQPSFRPDGTLLVTGETWTNPFSVGGMGQVETIGLEGGSYTPMGDVHAFHPVASPDGRSLAYWTAPDRVVWVANADGTAPERVAGRDGLAAWHPRWSRDGRYLWYLSEELGSTDLWRVPLADGRPSGPAEAVTVGFADEIHAFDLSADGRRVVFDADTRTSELVRVDLATGRSTPVVRGRQVIESFDASPDGLHLVYAVRGRTERILLADAAGTGVRELASGGRARDPRFSPDGRRVVFQWNAAGRYDIWVADVDSGALVNLTATAPDGSVDPQWRPDGAIVAKCGNRICAIPSDPGPWEVVSAPPKVPITPVFQADAARAILPLDHAVELHDTTTWTAYATTSALTQAAWWTSDELLGVDTTETLWAWNPSTNALRPVATALGGPATDVDLGVDGVAWVLVRRQASDLWVLDLPVPD